MSEELVKSSVTLAELDSVDVSCEQKDVVKSNNSAAGLLSSIPMLCRLESCPYSDGCALFAEGLVERGDRCPLELDLVKNMFVSYCRQLEINPDIEKIEAGLIKDLCSIEIQALRANKLMSFGEFLVDAIDAIDPVSGEVYYKKELHIAVSWSERLLSQKLRVLDALVASPLSRVKYKGETGNQSLQDRVAELKRRVDKFSSDNIREENVFDVTGWSDSEE